MMNYKMVKGRIISGGKNPSIVESLLKCSWKISQPSGGTYAVIMGFCFSKSKLTIKIWNQGPHNWKLDFIKLKVSCPSKEGIDQVKRKLRNQERIFVNCTPDRGSMPSTPDWGSMPSTSDWESMPSTYKGAYQMEDQSPGHLIEDQSPAYIKNIKTRRSQENQ